MKIRISLGDVPKVIDVSPGSIAEQEIAADLDNPLVVEVEHTESTVVDRMSVPNGVTLDKLTMQTMGPQGATGPTGPSGSIRVFDQQEEPTDPVAGDLWID